jgi:Tfp pilus assembly protein PilO
MIRYIFALIGVIIAGAIFFWYTKPTYDSVQGVKAESAQYDAALAKAAELQQLKQTLLTRYNSFNPTDLDRVLKLLPDHVDNVALILDLDNLAARYQMPIENVDVSTPASTGSTDNGGIATIGASGQKYDSVTIRFATRGTYTDFLALLNDLEMSLRVVDLVQLSLTPTGPDERTGELTYSYELTLRTYWLK